MVLRGSKPRIEWYEYELARSEGFVAAVAHGGCLAVLAGAEPFLAGRIGGIGQWSETGALMRAVAHRLIFTVATRAPVITFPGLHLNLDGALLCDGWFGFRHNDLLGWNERKFCGLSGVACHPGRTIQGGQAVQVGFMLSSPI